MKTRKIAQIVVATNAASTVNSLRMLFNERSLVKILINDLEEKRRIDLSTRRREIYLDGRREINVLVVK